MRAIETLGQAPQNEILGHIFQSKEQRVREVFDESTVAILGTGYIAREAIRQLGLLGVKKVFLGDNDEARLLAAEEACTQAGILYKTLKVDAADPEQIQEFIRMTRADNDSLAAFFDFVGLRTEGTLDALSMEEISHGLAAYRESALAILKGYQDAPQKTRVMFTVSIDAVLPIPGLAIPSVGASEVYNLFRVARREQIAQKTNQPSISMFLLGPVGNDPTNEVANKDSFMIRLTTWPVETGVRKLIEHTALEKPYGIGSLPAAFFAQAFRVADVFFPRATDVIFTAATRKSFEKSDMQPPAE